ncbi:Ig-like domain-containing protein, partial [Aeromicrobium sp.]|uniref:Ig-like domain-containing protein n=1 Tax=Aeromicrobium sp. TaxID=1871063 RepID=UPI002FC5DC68
TYAVSDGNGGTDQATLAITITGANDAPVATDDAGSATEAGTAAGANASGNVLSNDSDVDNGDTKSVASVRTGTEAGSGTAGTVGAALAGAYGSLTLNADGSYSYVVDDANATVNALNATQSLTDNFTYAVSDGNGGSDTATLAITITGANDAPASGGSQSVSGSEDDASIGGTVPPASDVDGDSLTYALVAGSVQINSATAPDGSVAFDADGSYSYATGADDQALNNGESRTITFQYVASDGSSQSAPATVTITVNGADDNLRPTARDDSATTDEDTAVVIDVLANDSDPEGEALTPQLVAGPENGAVAYDASSKKFTYTPGANFNGTDSFTYKISDTAGGASSPATVAITVNPINDRPVISSGAQAATVNELADGAAGEDATLNQRNGAITYTDPDASQTHSASFTPQGTGYVGTFSLGAVNDATDRVEWSFEVNDSALNYLAANQTLTQNYLVLVTDSAGASASQTVTITLRGANDPVTNLALSGQTAPENVPGAVVGVLSATDPDTADTLTYSILPGADGAKFTIVGNELRVGSTALDYETAATHTVNVRVTDGGGAS